MVTSNRLEEEVVGVLTELRGFEGEFSTLDAARILAAQAMLRRSDFDLILLPVGAAAPIVKRSRRHWWQRPEWRQER